MDDCAAHFAERGISLPDIDELAYGVVVGQVDLMDCVSALESPLWQGPVGWLVANPRPLPQAPLKRQLGLFEAEIVPTRRSAAR